LLLTSPYESARALVSNRWVQLVVGAIVSVGLGYAAFRSIAWRDVIDTFANFPVGYALLSLVPLVAAMLLRAARWSVLLKGEPVTFRQIFITQNAGIGLNNMLPYGLAARRSSLVS